MVTLIDIEDVSPVGNYHTIPVKPLFQPAGEQFLISVERNSVIGRRIDHNSQGSGLNASLEGREESLLEFARAYHRRSSVLSGDSGPISEEVFQAHCHMFGIYPVRIISLKTESELYTHTALHQRVFPETLPHTRPALITAQIQGRSENPRHVAGPGLIGTDIAHNERKFIVKGRGHSYLLREKGSSQSIGSSVNLIQTIQTRDAHLIQADILNLLDKLPVCPGGISHVLHSIQNGADFILSKDSLTLLGHVMCPRLQYGCGSELCHLSHLLLESHSRKDFLDFSLHLRVLRNGSWNFILARAKGKAQAQQSEKF